jgi:serine/threonine protein kinase
MEIIKTGDIIVGKFKLIKKIGTGSFGDIYSALVLDKRKIGVDFVAAKFEKEKVDKEVLHMEVGTLSYLQGFFFVKFYFILGVKHFTNIYHFGRHGSFRCLIMELLGPKFVVN